jgi:hypothetical protein
MRDEDGERGYYSMHALAGGWGGPEELTSRALIKSSPLPPRLHKILVSSSTVNAY